MIPLLRSKRKYAKAGEADNVDETNYGAPIEETSFIQPPPQRPPSDTGSYETYARSDTGEYCAYDQRHNQAARKMHQILRRIKMLKIAAVMQAPLLIVMVVMLFGYPELLFGDPCLSVNATTPMMNSTTTTMNSTATVSNTTLAPCEDGYTRLNGSDECIKKIFSSVIDLDECQMLAEPCGINEVCINKPGSYTCECRNGYERGDDKTCVRSTSMMSTTRTTTTTTTTMTLPAILHYEDWSECSRSCGVGQKRRAIKCLQAGIEVNLDKCEKSVLEDNAECNTQSCPDGQHVLAINTRKGNKQAVAINSAGGYTTLDFQFDDDTEVYSSCSIQWRNRMIVFGGDDDNKRGQISEIKSCRLTRIGTLTFHLHAGACANMDDAKIFLCFDWVNNEGKVCRVATDPLGTFSRIGDSHFHHYTTRTTASQDKILAVGSKDNSEYRAGEVAHNHVEYYSSETAQWRTSVDYPYEETMWEYEMVPHEDGFVVFGGIYTGSDGLYATSVIAKFNPDSNTWSKLGNLKNARHEFGMIQIGDEYLIVGGSRDKKTETCRLENNEMICIEREPTMTEFRFYPELFKIDASFIDRC